MLQSEQYMHKSIVESLLAGKVSASAAIAAADYAIQYGRSNKNASFSMLLDKAKFHAKHNKAAPAPTVKREIRQARLPNMPKWYVEP